MIVASIILKLAIIMPLNDPGTNPYVSEDVTGGMNLPEKQEYKEGTFGPDYLPDNPGNRWMLKAWRLWDGPVTWFRGM